MSSPQETLSSPVRRFFSSPAAAAGAAGIALLLIPALYAPFLVNGRPFFLSGPEGWSLPFLRYLFAPDTGERLVNQLFNYLALLLPLVLLLRKRRRLLAAAAVLLLLPFFLVPPRVDKTDYRQAADSAARAVFAPIPYGPLEIVAEPCEPPSWKHILGTDNVGRDAAARLVYGARASLAVGIISTLIALAIGTFVGLTAGYFRGWFDLCVMRLVEILLCFPTFLLLLILMSILGDHKFEQSMPVVILVIGFTGWIGLAFLVRGETLKQCGLPYIASCEVAGIPAGRIMFFHLLPNIMGPILITFTFGVAGAILAESSLSFLGFGVQPPAPSWGGLLRQAFDNPLDNWHLTFFPGLALFIAVLSFNFTGEGLRRL
ncbi:MAG: ABC transporter permease [Lentisphaeria bacterium]|nr:ABC transporter permease [Lentisphaeria bacterium]